MKKIFFPIILSLSIFIFLGLVPQQKVQAQVEITTPMRADSSQGIYKRKFDGMGPDGMGPRTGRGKGPCKKKGHQTYFIYFTGIGCPHCANVDPILLKEKVRNEDVLVIEYEIYQQRQNAPLLMAYNDKYKTGLGVPLLITEDCSKNKEIEGKVGSQQILNFLNQNILDNEGNNVVLVDKVRSFESLNISEIKGLPNLWYKNRVAMKKTVDSEESKAIKDFILKGIVPENASVSDIKEVSLSGSEVKVENAMKFDGWVLITTR
jgi:hypothetical protein